MAKIACLEAKVSQATINDTEEETENEQDAAGNSNRGHKALKKPKRGKRAARDVSSG